MKRLMTVLVFAAVGGSSCFSPVDVLLGVVDAGQLSPDSGAGGGGGAVATGGGQGGGGGLALNDAGLVTPLAHLAPARCGVARNIGGACQGDAGLCISLLRDGQPEVNVLTDLDVAPPTPFSLGPIGPASGGFLSLVRDGAGTQDSLWYARAGAAPHVVQSASDLSVIGVADQPAYGLWYIAVLRSSGGVETHDLMLAAGIAAGGTAQVAAPHLTQLPTSNAVAVGSTYYVAFPDGLYSFFADGGGRLVPLTSVSGEHETITRIAADATDIVFLQCTDFPARCALRRYDRSTNATTTLLRDLEQLVGSVSTGTSVALNAGHAYVLGVLHLLRVPRAGGAVEVVYSGEEFPQYTGTLRGDSLQAIDGKLYFGSVCEFDADAPTYGAVELDPVGLTARWLELDPNYPFVPYLERGVSESARAFATSAGVFVAR